jgi:precorrin-6A/cobalt-precorrin-6A reductase
MILGTLAMRILILGGTTEARTLAELVANDRRFGAILSLAGRTRAPAPQPVPCRIGGFGGPERLAAWLAAQRIAAVVDATHPFAVNISAHAVAATSARGIPLGSIIRPPWQAGAGDRWIGAATAAAAPAALGDQPRRVFLTLGRLELSAFAAAPQHAYLARTIDPPGDIALPPDIRFISERGPFDADAEARLLERERIEVLVSKNSGGAATHGKIEAARRLKLAVVMIERPQKSAGCRLADAVAAFRWLEGLDAAHAGPRSARGV